MKGCLRIPNIDDPIEGKILREKNQINETSIEFEVPDEPEPINSGDKTSTIIGKICRWIAHLKNTAFSGKYTDLLDRPETMPSHILRNIPVDVDNFNIQPNENNSNGITLISDGNHEILNIFGDKDTISPYCMQVELTIKKNVSVRRGAKTYTASSTGEQFPPKIVWDEKWQNLADFMDISRDAQSNNSSGLPCSTSVEILTDSSEIPIDNWRSGFYSVANHKQDSSWILYISARHRNGYNDGNQYGMYLATLMTNTNGDTDLYWNRQEPSGWQGDRIILDNHNYAKYIGELPTGNNLSKILRNYFDGEDFPNGIVSEINTFAGNPSTTYSSAIYALCDCTKVNQPIDAVLSFFWHEQFYSMQMGFKLNTQTHLLIRGRSGSNVLDWEPWKTVLDSENYSDYTLFQKTGVDNTYVNRTDLKPQLIDVIEDTLIDGFLKYWTILNIGAYEHPNVTPSSFRTQLLFPYQNQIEDTEMFIRTAKSEDGENSWRVSRRVLHDGNYQNIINQISNQLLLKQGSFVNCDIAAGPGQSGYINFARITIKSEYANHTCFFGIQCRNLGFPIFFSVAFKNENNLDPGLGAFYFWGSADYGVYISKKDTSVWDLWSLKSEPYDVIEILQMNVNKYYFDVTFPNEFRDVKEEQWMSPIEAGRVAGANHIYDTYNGNLITGAYGKPGINYNEITWLNCWNEYEMRGIHKNCFTYLKQISDPNSGSFFGLCIPPMAGGNDVNDQAWIRTTSEGLLPYLPGQSALGTSSWAFKDGYINYLHLLNLSTNSIYNATGASISFEQTAGIDFYSARYGKATGISFKFIGSKPSIQPSTNEKGSLGTSSYKFNDVYSVNSTITNSDKNLKKEISYIGKDSFYSTELSDDKLIKFIKALKPCVYLRKNGESGRAHHGFISQDFKHAMDLAGIIDHAAYIKSPKIEYIEKEVEQEREVYDEITKKTKIVKEKVKTQEERIIEGEYNEGLRYEEIISDHVRFSQILDKRITTLENIILSQTKEIEYLKQKLDELTTK